MTKTESRKKRRAWVVKREANEGLGGKSNKHEM
jgi:hypothetical protein